MKFNELTLERKGRRVTWEWIGEGNSGDYDPEDTEDTPLLRFSCYEYVESPEMALPESVGDDGTVAVHDSMEWIAMDDASYCTQMPINTPPQILAQAAAIIMEAIEDCSYKKRLEELSWLCLVDFQGFKCKACGEDVKVAKINLLTFPNNCDTLLLSTINKKVY